MVLKLVYFLLLVVLCKGFTGNNLKLKQVFIFSRHNIRYPLFSNKDLNKYSPNRWPKIHGTPGYLTPKGVQLEGYMGEYFLEWFKKEDFLPEGCPDEGTVYVYANKPSRTKATARAFVKSAFKNCNVTVHYKKGDKPDPLFSCVIHNATEAFKNMTIKEIKRKLENNAKLMTAYPELNKILEIEGSYLCKHDGICDLSKARNKIHYEVGQTVRIDGPLFIGHAAMDVFLMSYYDGMPVQDVAWGLVTTPEKWKLLTEIIRQEQNITFTTVAKDVATPLLNYLTEKFKNYDKMPKFMMIVGHDTNMNVLATAMGFEPIDDLPRQAESFPIGGKFVFQRWTHGENDFLKVEYVYPSSQQLRDGSKYLLESPPQRVMMRLKWCDTDEQGFCSWQEFIDKL